MSTNDTQMTNANTALYAVVCDSVDFDAGVLGIFDNRERAREYAVAAEVDTALTNLPTPDEWDEVDWDWQDEWEWAWDIVFRLAEEFADGRDRFGAFDGEGVTYISTAKVNPPLFDGD